MLSTTARPARQEGSPNVGAETFGLIVTDERGLVSCFSSDLEGMGLDVSPERIGRHWSELFPSFRRVPTSAGDDGDLVVILERSRRAFRVAKRPVVGVNGMRGGEMLFVRPFEDSGHEAVNVNQLAILSELAADVAHEINNPLTTISGWMQIFLTDATGDEPPRKEIESIQEELERIAKIVDRLLVFAQQPGTDVQLVDVNELLRSVVAFVQHQMRNAGVRVHSSLSPSVPAIEANPGQLKQVFYNLTVNARQAMCGGGELRVSTRPTGDASWVEVRFEDTGHGVAEDVRHRLFEPRFTTREAEGGNGLGLSVSRDIVRGIGGELDLESSSAAGSVFLVRLPVPSSDGKQRRAEASPRR